jgi:phosphopantetheinyl transferase
MLSPSEQLIFQRLDAVTKRSVFYDVWCRKEAVLKAVGIGLAGAIAKLEILYADESGTITTRQKIAFSDRGWLLSASKQDEYIEALALEDCPA